jgi:hypothetical protein
MATRRTPAAVDVPNVRDDLVAKFEAAAMRYPDRVADDGAVFSSPWHSYVARLRQGEPLEVGAWVLPRWARLRFGLTMSDYCRVEPSGVVVWIPWPTSRVRA